MNTRSHHIIAALRCSGAGDDDNDDNDQSMDDKLTQSAPQQRTRLEPKHCNADEVEVDFSGQSGILAKNQLKPNDNIVANEDIGSSQAKRQLPDKPELVDGKRAKQSSANEDMDDNEKEEEKDSGSHFDWEYDPEMCFCRQRHDNSFMISCDVCDEWFHGKCVNVTKQQGRVMEKEKRKWLCPTCVNSVANGVPRNELIRQADQKRAKLLAEARIRAQTKRVAKEKFLRREKLGENETKHQTATDRRHESDPTNKRSAQKSGQKSSTKQSQAGSADESGAASATLLAQKISQMPPKKRVVHRWVEKESDPIELIQSSTKDFNNKTVKKWAKDGGERRQSDSTGSDVGGAGELESISKAQPIKKLWSSTAPTTSITPDTPGVVQMPSVSNFCRQSVLTANDLAEWRERVKITLFEMIKLRKADKKRNKSIVNKKNNGKQPIELNTIGDTTTTTKESKLVQTNTTSSTGGSSLLDNLMSTSRTGSADDNDGRGQPTSTVLLSSPEVPSSVSALRPVWKGTIFMQNVANFAAYAVNVSGAAVDYLFMDLNDTIAVCGRIAPEPALDYVKKFKCSSRSDIGLVKFESRKEDRIGYDAFFDYLNTRGRYGVVGGTGNLQNIYILPLPKHNDVPNVLLPYEGPGLDKRSIRPNLLLGIIIGSKKQTTSDGSSNSLSNLCPLSLKDITIPDNLQDILSTVKHKIQEIEKKQERLRAAAATCFKIYDTIVKKFGTKSDLSGNQIVFV